MMSDKETFLHQLESNFKTYAIMKIYPNGYRKIIAASSPIFGGDGWEMSDKWDTKSSRKRDRDKKSSPADLMRSKRRAAAKLKDYALCNDFNYFVTLTLSAEKIDRYSLPEAVKRLRVWLDNRVRRHGLKYILVPEQHKDGAFHFHGFFNNAVQIIDSGTLKIDGIKAPKRPRSEKQRQEWLAACAKPVYNILDWELGFSTAIEIYGDYNAAIGYVSKYVTKQGDKLGGRWYYSGGDLRLPQVEKLDGLSFREVEQVNGSYCFEIPEAGLSMAILEVRGGKDDFGLFGSREESHGTD